MKIFLIRHGETDWNYEMKVQGGGSDIPLNQKGIEQAKKTGERLKNEEIHLTYASPLNRAHETAKHINKHHEHDIILHDALIERKFGKLEGSNFKDLEDNMKRIFLLNEFDKYEVERLEDFNKRLNEFWDDILSNHKGKNILIVSHSSVTKMLISIVKDIHINEARKLVGVKENASITILEFDEKGQIKDLKIGIKDHLY